MFTEYLLLVILSFMHVRVVVSVRIMIDYKGMISFMVSKEISDNCFLAHNMPAQIPLIHGKLIRMFLQVHVKPNNVVISHMITYV